MRSTAMRMPVPTTSMRMPMLECINANQIDNKAKNGDDKKTLVLHLIKRTLENRPMHHKKCNLPLAAQLVSRHSQT